MTLEEIYSKIVQHQIEGLMTHEQLANYYDFLGLKGYKRCHEYHYLVESCSFRATNRYFINHHNKLIPNTEVGNPDIIPNSWYKSERFEVTPNIIQSGVKTAIRSWVDWERETKALYQEMYNELILIGEVASAGYVKSLICDVDHELKCAERIMLELKAVDFDMCYIIGKQDELHHKYKKKTRKIGISIC